ncbi:astacin-like metalloprotease toxin 5 [Tetranychus urticae]|uniref:astacin-like metalloprotease toxin 5 n=1 Tax=Tetranychus urticae TaxID=32264 RepID=UPI000D652492|nr:astacin-like metalloprotease toxin 5 [Tetranychus urticae]
MILKHSTFFLCLIIYLSSSIHSTHGQVMAPGSLWPRRVIIPYEIDPALDPHRATILAAMNEISGTTCIKFRPRYNQSRYLNIKSSQK